MTQTRMTSASVGLTVNGEEREVTGGSTLAELLADLGLDPRMIIVEYNRTILRDREAYPAIELQEGDALELVHFVGGG